MTDEEMQKTMEFILNQRAQFAADIQKLQERQAETESLIGRLAVVTTKGFEDVDRRISALVDAQMRAEEKLNKTAGDLNEKMSALADAQIRTEEGLNRTNEVVKKTNEDLRNLIAVVDRHLSEGHTGRNGK